MVVQASDEEMRAIEARAQRHAAVRFWRFVSMWLPAGKWGFRQYDKAVDLAVNQEFAEAAYAWYLARVEEPEEG